MPTVLVFEYFRIKLFAPPREHGPLHVHAHKGRRPIAIVRLALDGGPPRRWEVYDARPKDVVMAFRPVDTHHDELQLAWEKLHG